MPYSTTISGLDFSGGMSNIRIFAGYTFSVVGGGGSAPLEVRQDEVTLDLTPVQFQPGPNTFAFAGSLVPIPDPTWFTAMWIQEIPRIANDTGWLFRSGRFTTDLPTDPVEVILAPEQLIGNPELAAAIGPLPMTQGSTTITSILLAVSGADVAVTATGSDTQLPPGDTFTYTATMQLLPNGSLRDPDQPFEIRLSNASLSFTAGTGQGFVTFLLNAIAGLILSNIAPKVKATIKSTLNAGVLSSVATQLNRGVPSTMPAGVVLSVRSVHATVRPPRTGTENVIGVFAALGAFGGVSNKFPALSTGGSRCFVATAAAGPDAPEVQILRDWRDRWLRERIGGVHLIRTYEKLSPPLASRIADSNRARSIVRNVIVVPAARLARWLLRNSNDEPR